MLNNPEISVGRIPLVFLITDGCVNNEKEIVNWGKTSAGSVRVFTLGIGPYCNKYFLKMLSMWTRGYNEHTMDTKNIGHKILGLMSKTIVPVCMNVEIETSTKITV